MDTVSRFSPAKLNLTLHVARKRADGFHEIESLVAQINLGDTVTVTAHEDGCYALDCDDSHVPRDGSNLVLQAAKALNAVARTNHGVRIDLKKRIPVGAGLGGGSSNAAATLLALNELWRVGLSGDQLARLGAELGSDVPLFFHGPLCVIRARGEQVETVAPALALWAALILPDLQCPTAAIYAAWDRLPPAPPRPAPRDVLAARGSASELMERLFNDLEPAAFNVAPALRELAARASEAGGQPVRVTGSGAALFRLFDDAEAAARFALAVATALDTRVDVVALRT